MARLYNLDKIRDIVGEEDVNNTVTNKRLREAAELSQAEFFIETANITVTITEKERELVNFGAVAYFYNLENGDDKLVTTYTEKLKTFVEKQFGRPKFITRGKF